MTVNKVVHLINACVGFLDFTDQFVVLVELAVSVGIGIDFKYCACQLIVGIISVNLRGLDIATNMLVDNLNFNNIAVLADCNGIDGIIEDKACRLFDFSDIPSAVRDSILAKGEAAVLG